WLAAQAGSSVAAVSTFTGERLERRRLRRGELPIVPNGITIEAIRAAAGERIEGPPLIYAGRLLREKRIDVLLEAIAILKQDRPGTLLMVTGSGPDEERL